MKIVKVIFALLVVFFMGWALSEQTKEKPLIWVQVVGVALFFFAMYRLMKKTPSNNMPQNAAEREFDKGIKQDFINQSKEEEDVK